MTKPKVIVTERVSEKGIALLQQEMDVTYRDGISRQELLEIIGEYDALIVRSVTQVDEELITAAKKLKVVGRAGNGIDNIDVPACTRRGIVVSNTPDSNTISAAEQTIGLILASSRNIPQANAFVKGGRWDRKPFRGAELYGKTVGIVGLGRIGSMVAERLASFKMKVIAYDPYIPDERFVRFGAEKKNTLEELVREADFITVHTPRNQETMGMIGRRELAMAKDGVRVINCARGGIINEQALLEALESGKVASAGLDVFEEEPALNNPLFRFNNVVVTPHLGADTKEAQERVGINIAEQVIKALKGELVPNVVNLPTILRQDLEFIRPFIELCEAMGKFYFQIEKAPIDRVEITYCGEVANHDREILTIAFLKGLFTPVVADRINYVNARMVAEERGLKVYEKKGHKEENYINLIKVKIFNHKYKLELAGTLTFAGEPVIVEFNGYETDILPVGHVVIAENEDRPRVIGPFTTVFGDAGINIAMMRVARKVKGDIALMVVNVDAEVDPDTLAKLKAIDGISNVKVLNF
ncbi:MAG: phosphoglycerate dehydrogenase [Syntrophomonadaceae bacterium]|jgi:D-3-phosphoglycerate dehydrogenase|nr:phosphoglycerate dehydrogenase [Syntrophomonadaceae bacterium]